MEFQHVFFDLDRTLWDFEKNSHETLIELFDAFSLNKRGIKSAKDFIKKYKKNNEELWSLYRIGKIAKKDLRNSRFNITLKEYGIFDIELSDKLADFYVNICPKKTQLFPHALSVLEYLQKKYQLHIITNGFQEVQHIKMQESSLDPFFKEIITSEQLGVKKPNPAIFQYAVEKAKASINTSIMIGDDLQVDILGAKEFGMSQIYFNPNNIYHNEIVSYEINCLSELLEIL